MFNMGTRVSEKHVATIFVSSLHSVVRIWSIYTYRLQGKYSLRSMEENGAEAACSSKMLAWCHNPEDYNLNTHNHEHLKIYIQQHRFTSCKDTQFGSYLKHLLSMQNENDELHKYIVTVYLIYTRTSNTTLKLSSVIHKVLSHIIGTGKGCRN
jgi:hypothetical protein